MTSLDTIPSAATVHLKAIENVAHDIKEAINKATDKGEFEIDIDFSLHGVIRGKLQNLGYDISSDINKTTISWRYLREQENE